MISKQVYVDVIAAFTKTIIRLFPSMIDIGTGDTPTYVSNFRYCDIFSVKNKLNNKVIIIKPMV